MRLIFSFILGSVLLAACTKVEGKGGAATIKGVVYKQKYNSLGNPISGGRYAASDEDVYIIYGDGSTYYDDNLKTSYDGSFEFRYLQKGKYTVFVYEDCTTCQSGKLEKLYSVEVTDKKGVIVMDTIEIKKQL